ncbi:MAG: 30S ribosome-binding factor RbfA [Candidatus Komeilibacteria bacterium]|nr:30S ribosome-binding factor RbfA [Candidatus Komeilibacteria bacterium]
MSQRTEQLASLIQHNLNEILIRDIELPPNIFVTITRTDVTPDLSWAFIYISVLPEGRQGTALTALQKQARAMQTKLNRTLHLAKFPRLRFKIDEVELKAREIDDAINKLHQ